MLRNFSDQHTTRHFANGLTDEEEEKEEEYPAQEQLESTGAIFEQIRVSLPN